jgi:hypothetical protein
LDFSENLFFCFGGPKDHVHKMKKKGILSEDKVKSEGEEEEERKGKKEEEKEEEKGRKKEREGLEMNVKYLDIKARSLIYLLFAFIFFILFELIDCISVDRKWTSLPPLLLRSASSKASPLSSSNQKILEFMSIICHNQSVWIYGGRTCPLLTSPLSLHSSPSPTQSPSSPQNTSLRTSQDSEHGSSFSLSLSLPSSLSPFLSLSLPLSLCSN